MTIKIQPAGVFPGFERVAAFQHEGSGLRGILAIHNTRLGPALGGVRLKNYATDAEALDDVMKLSRGMTYKCALAELPAGGGKAVIFDDPGMIRAEAFRAFGELVESLGGHYCTGPDVGIHEEDLRNVAKATRWVTDESDPRLGDISLHTAIGVWHGIRACLDHAGIGKASVAIQGLGNVGMRLAEILRREGHMVLAADVDPGRVAQAVARFGARAVPAEQIAAEACDVFAPCALGGVLNRAAVHALRCRIVCGAANNVLESPEAGDELRGRGIAYAPDYLVNAGGVIRGGEYFLLNSDDSMPSIARIYSRTRQVLRESDESGVSAARIADRMAESRFQA
ncbi:MAG: hypothetical protein K2X35_06130 [Bryobacteraceae bacterium]|nr:hypothetical protein [Bryobacteraceae bacterium]